MCDSRHSYVGRLWADIVNLCEKSWGQVTAPIHHVGVTVTHNPTVSYTAVVDTLGYIVLLTVRISLSNYVCGCITIPLVSWAALGSSALGIGLNQSNTN